ncbi:hypothetical protein HYS47_03130 [Candidatus Woesearchaeota archaeon]|nr:hypothetical protein [Candidatus Woesearchaeota archaeon]
MPTYRYPLLYGDTNLQDVFTYLTVSFEALFVLEGIKPGIRISVPEHRLYDVKAFCQAHGLVMDVSEFKVVNSITGDKQFANLGYRIRADSSIKGDVFAYLSLHADWVRAAKEADAGNDHRMFGIELGYPSCCVSFYERHAREEMKKENDYILPLLRNSASFFFENNIIPRYFDIGVLSHFPCSFGCKESRDMARQLLAIVARYSEGLASYVAGILRIPVVMTEHDGAHLLHHSQADGYTMSYGGVQSTVANRLHYDLERQKSIPLNNPNLILFS